MREVALLQYDHGVLHMPVQGLHVQPCPHSQPTLTPLEWALPWSRFSQEGNSMRLKFSHRGGSPTDIPSQHRAVSIGGMQSTPTTGTLHSLGTAPISSGGPGS